MQRWIALVLVLAGLVLVTARFRPAPWVLLVGAAAVIGLAIALEARHRLARAARARYELARDRAETAEALARLDAALAALDGAPVATRNAFGRAAGALRQIDGVVRDDPAKAVHVAAVRGLTGRVAELVGGYAAMRGLDTPTARAAVAATDARAEVIAQRVQEALDDLLRGDALRLRALGELLAGDEVDDQLRSFETRLAATPEKAS